MECICTNNHFTANRVDEVIAKIKWCSFSGPTVYIFFTVYVQQCQRSQAIFPHTRPQTTDVMFITDSIIVVQIYWTHVRPVRPHAGAPAEEFGRFTGRLRQSGRR